MDMLMALALSIGILIAAWVKLGPMANLAVPAGIIAWGCFFAAGGKMQGLQKTVAATISGVFRVMASHTQNTPDIVAATVFCRPCILPPAAKKHPQAMMPAGTARVATGPRLTQAAVKIPMLSASAISMSICSSLRSGEISENAPLVHARVMRRSRCRTALRHSLYPA